MAGALLRPAAGPAGVAAALPLSGEETTVLAADGADGEASTLIGAGAPLPLAPHKRRVPFRFLLAAAAALLLALLLLLDLLNGSDPKPSSSTTATTTPTVLPTTTPPTTAAPTTVAPATRTRDTVPPQNRRGRKGGGKGGD
jgi:hypothetical protein